MTNVSLSDISTTLSTDLEPATCPICGPDASAVLRYDFDPYKVLACSSCGLNYLSPRMTETAILKLYKDEAYYNSNVSGQGYDEYLDIGNNWEKTFRLRLKQIAPHKSSGRVLDIGCGPGYFLTAAQKLGFDVYGLDPSDYIVAQASKTWGERIQLGTIDTANYQPGYFDLIVAFDTFEHIYDPLRFLEAARGLLKPRGILTITTPDSTSWLARTSGKRWVSFKIPEHVFYWSPATIARAFQGRFEILEVKRAGQYATLGFLFRRLFGLGPKAVGPVQPLLQILSRISVYADNGSLTVIAAKE